MFCVSACFDLKMPMPKLKMKKNVFMGGTTLRGHRLPPQGILKDKLLISNFHSFILETAQGVNYASHSAFHINIQIKLLQPFEYPLCSKPEFRTKEDKLWISNFHFSFQRRAQVGIAQTTKLFT